MKLMTNSTATPAKAGTMEMTRRFAFPREQVFQAWTSADRVKRWFCPEDYTVPEAEVDFRPGGVFAVCMRSPEGEDFWSRGNYGEIVPPERIEFVSSVFIGDAMKFTANTVATFQDGGAGTLLTVRQDYDVHDPAFAQVTDGAREGWRSTLDKLERELARAGAAPE
jgi:uncharacterized protein YndB with AHSA1/START domain